METLHFTVYESDGFIEGIASESSDPEHGGMYLGRTNLAINARHFMPASLTSALREFNLPNTVSPGDWP